MKKDKKKKNDNLPKKQEINKGYLWLGIVTIVIIAIVGIVMYSNGGYTAIKVKKYNQRVTKQYQNKLDKTSSFFGFPSSQAIYINLLEKYDSKMGDANYASNLIHYYGEGNGSFIASGNGWSENETPNQLAISEYNITRARQENGTKDANYSYLIGNSPVTNKIIRVFPSENGDDINVIRNIIPASFGKECLGTKNTIYWKPYDDYQVTFFKNNNQMMAYIQFTKTVSKNQGNDDVSQFFLNNEVKINNTIYKSQYNNIEDSYKGKEFKKVYNTSKTILNGTSFIFYLNAQNTNNTQGNNNDNGMLYLNNNPLSNLIPTGEGRTF